MSKKLMGHAPVLHSVPVGAKRVPLARSDLWYWFGTLDHCWRPMEEKDYAISREMVAYLMNFCKTGNPNGEDTPVEWLPIAKGQNKVLRVGEQPTHLGGVNIAKLNYTMLTNKAVGE